VRARPSFWLASLAGAILLAALPRAAVAGLDPARAESDARAALQARAYPFCRDPRTPLSARARALCPEAAEIPACEGFARACRDEDPESLWRRLARWIGGLLSDATKERLARTLGPLFRAAFWVTASAAVLGVLWLVLRAVGRAQVGSPVSGRREAAAERVPEAVPEDRSGEDLLAIAEARARAGDGESALQIYLEASLRALHRRGALRLAKDTTNGEYVRACADEGTRAALGEIVRDVDRVQFGRSTAGQDVIARAARLATRIVHAGPMLLLALALPAMVGCTGLRLPSAGDDPAGDELFREILRRQGVQVLGLRGRIASLPILPADADEDDEDAAEPALVVDAERTPLEPEAREHLVEWVRAGGVLVLAGAPEEWPPELGAEPSATDTRAITVRPLSDEPGGERLEHGTLAQPQGILVSGPSAHVAWFEDDTAYAAEVSLGAGHVLLLASDDLMTNAGLARPGNAAAMIAILTNANRRAFRLARPEDGVEPPASPLATLIRAGLGVPLGHALAGAALLFLAAGVRLTRPRPAATQVRRAFAEHVEAVGALYAATRSAPHALAVYVAFVRERLRARAPRGSTDVPALLAARSGLSLDASRALWARATSRVQAPPGPPNSPASPATPAGDELVVLRDLAAACSAALASDE
jgi:hypothetical protein